MTFEEWWKTQGNASPLVKSWAHDAWVVAQVQCDLETPSPEGETMFLCKRKGNVFAAYPRKVQAEVYASGFSRDDVEIIEGRFVTTDPQPQRVPSKEE